MATWYLRFGKRILDLSVACLALVVTAPVGLLVIFLIRITMGRPVLFRQQRAGFQGRTFTIYKFRTMTDERDSNGDLLPNEKRLTFVGWWLRKLSADELPQLWNIIRGDMSFVGPRPLFVEYLPYYTPREQLRHSVPPGLTGLAQVSGRNDLDWDRRLELDAQYAESLSLILDGLIALKTIVRVLGCRNVTVTTGHNFGLLSDFRASHQERAA